jgi:hypothetical protein
VSESTPSRFAFASAALNLASDSCSTVSEPSREGTEAFVGGCSDFLCGSGGGDSAELALVGTVLTGLGGFTELALLGWGGLLTGRGGFTELGFSSGLRAANALLVQGAGATIQCRDPVVPVCVPSITVGRECGAPNTCVRRRVHQRERPGVRLKKQ